MAFAATCRLRIACKWEPPGISRAPPREHAVGGAKAARSMAGKVQRFQRPFRLQRRRLAPG
eukprot:8537293-Prorocentrum_lima.AAC.1